MGNRAFGLLALVPAAGAIWIVSLFAQGFTPLTFRAEWVPAANLTLDLRMDALSALFCLIILGIGSLVLVYCWGYFEVNRRRLAVFASQMVAFALAMVGLVVSDSLLLMYVFWECTSILSYLLVGYYGERASSRRAASQALMVTTLGGLAMLMGIVMLGQQTGAWTLSELASYKNLYSTPYVRFAVVLLLAGALSKSAIAPAHFWLPGAMAAPTPVSAYLHSAAMVKAGIYLVARLSPSFSVIPAWHLVVIPCGLFTMIMAGWMALRQKDLKLILAYGTVSQLGFLVAIVGIGSRAAMLAGLAITVAHACFKACLFMVVGAIDHATGTRDVRKLDGLGAKQPGLAALAIVAALSMAGAPPTLGFVAKEQVLTVLIYEQALTGMPAKLTLAGAVIGSMLTVAYSLYFLYGAFATKRATSPAVESMHRIISGLWIPPLVLAVASVALGVVPQPVDTVIATHITGRFGASASDHHLALWHGFTPVLALTCAILAIGSVLHWQRATVAKLHFQQPALGSANAAYDRVVQTLQRVSLRMTATTQRGSLPLNQAIIMGTLVLFPVIVLINGKRNPIRMELWGTPVQAFVAVLIMIAAIAATVLRNRLSALIMVGLTGYGISVIFALYGAPDLALTQMLVETISVVVFVLVLRKLPSSAPQPQGYLRVRAWLAIAVGLTVIILGAFAISARTATPISDVIPRLAKDIGHGANAVNVLLVDIRAWDTFGEISVLVIVATGVASLVYRTRSFSRSSRRPVLRLGGSPWLATNAPAASVDRNRSLMVEVSTRVLFHSMMLLSAYFFFAGHNAPGGGFAGGLVAALAVTLRYLAGGRFELDEAIPIDAGRILGVGLLTSAASVVVPLALGYPPLTSAAWDVPLPLIGEVHIVSAVFFDAGVYLIVIGLVLHILRSLGAQLDMDKDLRKQRARDRARRLARKER